MGSPRKASLLYSVHATWGLFRGPSQMPCLVVSGVFHWIATCKVSLQLVTLEIQTTAIRRQGEHCSRSMPPLRPFEGTRDESESPWPSLSSQAILLYFYPTGGGSPAPAPRLFLVSPSTPSASSTTFAQRVPINYLQRTWMSHKHMVQNLSKTEGTIFTFLPLTSPPCLFLPLYFQAQ